MPASTAAAAPILPVLYQLRVAAAGPWRVRVFNLPALVPGQAPTLPFLRELAAWPPGGPVREWHPDGGGSQLTVLRLAGPDEGPVRDERAYFDAGLVRKYEQACIFVRPWFFPALRRGKTTSLRCRQQAVGKQRPACRRSFSPVRFFASSFYPSA